MPSFLETKQLFKFHPLIWWKTGNLYESTAKLQAFELLAAQSNCLFYNWWPLLCFLCSKCAFHLDIYIHIPTSWETSKGSKVLDLCVVLISELPHKACLLAQRITWTMVVETSCSHNTHSCTTTKLSKTFLHNLWPIHLSVVAWEDLSPTLTIYAAFRLFGIPELFLLNFQFSLIAFEMVSISTDVLFMLVAGMVEGFHYLFKNQF